MDHKELRENLADVVALLEIKANKLATHYQMALDTIKVLKEDIKILEAELEKEKKWSASLVDDLEAG